jgi:hypothetical protein
MSDALGKYEISGKNKKPKKHLVLILSTSVVLAGGAAFGRVYYQGIQSHKSDFSKSCGKYVAKINSTYTDFANASYKPNLLSTSGDSQSAGSDSLRDLKLSVSAYEKFLLTNSKYFGSKQSAKELQEFKKTLAGFINLKNKHLDQELYNPHWSEMNLLVRFYQANVYRVLINYDDPILRNIEKKLFEAESKFDKYMDENFNPKLLASQNLAMKAKTPLTQLCSSSRN